MRATGSLGLIAIGLAVGMGATMFYLGQSRPAGGPHEEKRAVRLAPIGVKGV